MSSTWPLLKIKDYPIQIIDGDGGSNYPNKSELLKSGYCLFLNTGNVTKTGFDFSSCAFIDKEKHSVLRKGTLSRFDTILTTRGTIGNVAFYSSSVVLDNIRINSGMLILRPDPKYLLPEFFYQLMRSEVFQKQAELFMYGAAQPQLPITTLKHISLPLPQLDTQKKISVILSAYDNLIENNLERIKLLEEMAKITYEEWFVRMKFPGHEVVKIDSQTGLPTGWKPQTLRGVTSYINRGVAPKYVEEDGFPVINQKCIRGHRVNFAESRLTASEHKVPTDKLLQPLDILVNSTGTGTLGRVAQLFDCSDRATVDTHVTTLRAM
ncbi:hypothetical protein DA717_14235, partial [Piscirickettsiaceae bacterium NZ-RLO2]